MSKRKITKEEINAAINEILDDLFWLTYKKAWAAFAPFYAQRNKRKR